MHKVHLSQLFWYKKTHPRRLRQRWAYTFKASVWKPGNSEKSSVHDETTHLVEISGGEKEF
jgi:hypothetical protein